MQAATQAHGDRSKWDQQQAALERVREQGIYATPKSPMQYLYIGSLKCVIGAIARATHRANMQQTAGRRSQAIGSLNVCGCNGLPVSDVLLSDPMRRPSLQYSSKRLLLPVCLCADHSGDMRGPPQLSV